MDLLELAVKIGMYFIPFLFALTFHEFAHGYIAKKRGDNTAEMMGRLSMNPIVHMDWLGTFILPIAAIAFSSPIFFGWAKPVPVNPRNLKNSRIDMFWIALAGPLSNVLLAVLGAIMMAFVSKSGLFAGSSNALLNILNVFVMTNLFLAVFNIIPLHPLDGGKVLARFLPPSINQKLEDNEQASGLILMFLVLTGMLKVLSLPVLWGHQFLINLFMGLA